ncbi:amidohydrolase family protein [Bernardetia sp. ABR2-2B]|uniref:amidohydrolase family protein n=1 Tax=Bernardetia sp. ABR2-2B TaxID=3127472 RepID=UPI0030D48546
MKNQAQYLVLLIASIFTLISCNKKITKESISADLVIRNVNIINVETGEIDYYQDLVITKNKIQSIFPYNKNLKYKAEKIIDGSDKYLISGLWDMHTHLSMIGEESIPLFILNGVTGVRDMGGNWSDLKKWRALENKPNQDIYPTIKTAGYMLESPRFYGLLKQILGENYVKDRIPIASEEQAKTVVDSLSKIGIDLIKVRTVKSPKIFEAIASACKQNNISFTGHIEQNIGIQFAIENGISTIEHDVFMQSLNMTKEEIGNTLQVIQEADVYFTPTMLATYNYRLRPKEELKKLTTDTLNKNNEFRKYLSPNLIESWEIQLTTQALEAPTNWDSLIVPLRSFAKSIAKKTTVLAGTDVGVPAIIPGQGLHEELKMLVQQMGLSNLQALQAATVNATQNLGLQNEYGLVKVNYQADLLILNSNPLKEITNTSDIFSIIKNGNIIDQNTVKERLINIAKKVEENTKNYQPNTLYHLQTVLEKMRKAVQK